MCAINVTNACITSEYSSLNPLAEKKITNNFLGLNKKLKFELTKTEVHKNILIFFDILTFLSNFEI